MPRPEPGDEMEYIKAQELSAASFKPFGHVIELPDRNPDITRDNLSWWGNLFDIPRTDIFSLGFLRIYRKSFVTDALERHIKAPEIFIPIQGTGVMPFAPASPAGEEPAVPNESALTAFILDGTKGIVINQGVWHSPGLAVTGQLDFILTVRKETADDIDIKMIKPQRILL